MMGKFSQQMNKMGMGGMSEPDNDESGMMAEKDGMMSKMMDMMQQMSPEQMQQMMVMMQQMLQEG